MSSGIPSAAELIERTKQKWMTEGLAVPPGVSAAALREFEVRYGVRLPPDLREYFSAMDGMRHWDMCEDAFTFLPLGKVKAVPEEIAAFGGIPDYREIVRTVPGNVAPVQRPELRLALVI